MPLGLGSSGRGAGGCDPAGHPPVMWSPAVRRKFVRYMQLRGVSDGYLRKSVLSYLDRFMPAGGLSGPEDVLEMFVRCQRGHGHLRCALLALLRFYEQVMRYPSDFIRALKEAITAGRL